MKKILLTIAIMVLITSTSFADKGVVFNYGEKTETINSVIKEGRTYIAGADLGKLLGLAVNYDKPTKQVRMFNHLDRKDITLIVGSDAIIQKDRAYVPVRKVVDGLGYTLDVTNGAITIVAPSQPDKVPEGLDVADGSKLKSDEFILKLTAMRPKDDRYVKCIRDSKTFYVEVNDFTSYYGLRTFYTGDGAVLNIATLDSNYELKKVIGLHFNGRTMYIDEKVDGYEDFFNLKYNDVTDAMLYRDGLLYVNYWLVTSILDIKNDVNWDTYTVH